ncbi:ras-related protein Rab-34 isoform X2 [Podarcis muralis]
MGAEERRGLAALVLWTARAPLRLRRAPGSVRDDQEESLRESPHLFLPRDQILGGLPSLRLRPPRLGCRRTWKERVSRHPGSPPPPHPLEFPGIGLRDPPPPPLRLQTSSERDQRRRGGRLENLAACSNSVAPACCQPGRFHLRHCFGGAPWIVLWVPCMNEVGILDSSAVKPRVPTMNILAPVRRDRVIAELPPCFTKGAALHSRSAFHPKVVGMCQSQRTGTVGFKISKIIVVGDLSVGKTCLINRFCKDTFDKNYKATIGVDFEMERFEVLGVPFSLQLWDTAGQERFKCIASTYYRGAQAIIIVFDLNDVASLGHTRQWLADALKENDPSSAILFLVGTKKDLSSPAQYSLIEREALKVAKEMEAEYWAVSSLTGENVREFFFRVAALTFEGSVMAELERSSARRIGDVVRTRNLFCS